MSNENYSISTDTSKMDVTLIHDYLCNDSYWAKGRSMSLVKRSMENSICFGLFFQDGTQVGFARVVTDKVVFAWVMDVFVVKSHQGKGLGRALLDYISCHPDIKTVNGIGLRTNDARQFYRKFGFNTIENPKTWLFKKNTPCE
ncbi:MAG: GNAT family N-acetyltransferase [Bacteroidota bacterium]